MVSTLVGLKRFLAGVTRRPDRLKGLSLLLLATGTATTTLVRWASRESYSWCTVHQESRSTVLSAGGSASYTRHSFWKLFRGVGVPWRPPWPPR